MCGRYTLIQTSELHERFEAANTVPQIEPNYNVAPGHNMPVITTNGDQRDLKIMKWGLVPAWSAEPKSKFSTINARAEGLQDSRLYSKPFLTKRCIIPADGFYEWQKNSNAKVPYYIKLSKGGLFGFAGLYEVWHPGTEDELYSYTIITTSANSVVEPIHDRMPVILQPQHEHAWLDSSIDDPHTLYSFLKPYNPQEMEAYPVSTKVNSVKNNQPDLILNSQ